MKSYLFAFLIICFTGVSISAQVLSVFPTEMNVLFIGVTNPLTIAVEGVPDEKLNITMKNGFITKVGRGKYNAIVDRLGVAVITASWDNQKVSTTFRIKSIPNPQVFFINDTLTCKKNNEYIKCRPIGLMPEFITENIIKCAIKSYTVVYLPKNNDPQEFKNIDPQEFKVTGQIFPQNLTDIVRKAKIGDKFSFLEIRYQCAGDFNNGFTNTLEYVVKD
jgi:hypothetical protein